MRAVARWRAQTVFLVRMKSASVPKTRLWIKATTAWVCLYPRSSIARGRFSVRAQAAIRAGFDKAFSAILDSNVTAFIAGLVLWVVGRGAIRGFAVVLTLGILTSMFTSLMGSRALITLMYGGRSKVARLSIG